jgi:hypothetical protein
MGVRLSFFYAEGVSFLEILNREYTGFRQWAIERPSPDLFFVQEQTLSFLLNHEESPSPDSIEEHLLNQLVSDTWEYLSVVQKKNTFQYLGPLLKIGTYEQDLLWITESEVLYCWNFLLHGRSISNPENFFRAIDPEAVKLGYWTDTEKNMMLEKLGRVYRRGIFPAVAAVLHVLEENRDKKGSILFSIA